MELEISLLFSGNVIGFFREENLLKLKDLESKKENLIRQKEDNWWMKSREPWLEWGDNNTKYFHKFSNRRKSVNTIGV